MFDALTSMASSPSIEASVRSSASQSARARLIHDVRVALRRSGHSELRQVEIDVDRDALVINGRVPSFYLKQLSQELTRSAAPDHRIRNNLVVRVPPR